MTPRQPFHWHALLDFLRPRLIAGWESIDNDVYRRGDVTVRYDGRRLHASSDDPEVLARVRRLFDVDADVDAIAAHLGKDKLLAPLLKKHPGLRVPGAWDPFEVAVRTIVGQQVSIAGATTIMSRIVSRYGTSPERIARGRTNPGMPQSRWEAIRALARAVAKTELRLECGGKAAALLDYHGIGPWTAEYLAMRVFRDTDAFPYNDYGIRKALGTTNDKQVIERAECWRPWRAYAAVLLWRSLSS